MVPAYGRPRRAAPTVGGTEDLNMNEEKSAPGGSGRERARVVEVRCETVKRSNRRAGIRKISFFGKIPKSKLLGKNED